MQLFLLIYLNRYKEKFEKLNVEVSSNYMGVFDLLTGLIFFMGNNCVFKLDESVFSLVIEEIEEKDTQVSLSRAFGLENKPQPQAELPSFTTLVAKDFEKRKRIHFHIKKVYKTQPNTFEVTLDSYIIFHGYETFFDSLKVEADELDWFYPIKTAFDEYRFSNDGKTQLQLNPFDKSTEEFEFRLEKTMVKGSLSVSRNINIESTTPLKLSSNLTYFFEETKDVATAKKLLLATKELLSFVSYRRNSHINKVTLGKKHDNGYYLVGELFINYSKPEEKELEKIIKERIISYSLINSSFTNLLEKISDNKVYSRHIPETYRLKNSYNAARFIMATAGFEWQYGLTYKEKIEHDKNRYELERQEVLDFLSEKVGESLDNRNRRRFFNNAKNNYKDYQTNFAGKIIRALKDSEEVLKDFIESYYNLNNIEISTGDFKNNFAKMCPEIAKRIQDQRNAIAHGNLEVEFDNSFTTDLSILEWLFYAMVLQDIGLTKENVKKAINNLFDLKFKYL